MTDDVIDHIDRVDGVPFPWEVASTRHNCGAVARLHSATIGTPMKRAILDRATHLVESVLAIRAVHDVLSFRLYRLSASIAFG